MTARRIENDETSSMPIGEDAIGASLGREAWSDMRDGRHCRGGGSASSALDELPGLTICEEIGRGIGRGVRSVLEEEFAARRLEDRLSDHDGDWKAHGKGKADSGICHAWDLENLNENKRR